MPVALPVCLACRRPLDPEPDGVSLSLDGPDALSAARRVATERPADQVAQAVVRELLGGLCRTCGRPLP